MFDIFTIGSATQDVFLKSPYFKVLRDKKHLKKIGFPAGEAQCFALGGKIEISEPIFSTGGGATNTAVTFAKQGLKVATLIRVGADESGAAIVDELKKEKIKTFAIKDKKARTGYDSVLLSPEGERTILVHRGASEGLTKKEIPFGDIKTSWAYISPGNISFEVIDSTVDFLFKKGISIAINPSKKMVDRKLAGLKNILRKSKVVILNREEASYLTGIDYDDEKNIFRKLDKATPGIAVMTDGERGTMVSDGYRLYKAGVFKVGKTVDSLGAGDAFGSGFVAGLIQNKEKCEKGICRSFNIEYAMRLGSANAASVVEKIGAKAGILTRKEFEKNKRWGRLKINIIKI
jgi:sugar/nucleoside kinase (ribokinase family)